jgi:hypothetical protein
MSFLSPINSTGSSSRRSGSPEIHLSACLDSGIPLPVKLLDLARMDLIFITDRPLRFGTAIQVSIYSDFVSAVTQNRAVVHWCRPHPMGWQIGAFLGQNLPDRLTENHWNDLRGSLRYECNWKAWVLWDEGGELEAVKILDYSIGGLRLTVSKPVSVNQSLSLFGSSGSRERAVLNGQVQWCRTVEQICQAGVMVFGQRGRELPRMFGNLDAVHVDGSKPDFEQAVESPETLRFEQALGERFMPAAKTERKRNVRFDEHYDEPQQ